MRNNELGPSAGNADGLRFNSHDDALNFAREVTEDGNRWLSAHHFNVAEGYLEGKTEVVLQVWLPCSREYEFLFRVIPDGGHNLSRPRNAQVVDTKSVCSGQGD